MKKVVLILAVLSLVFVSPAMAGQTKAQGAIGDGNVGIQTNGAVKDNVIIGGGNDINLGANAGGEIDNSSSASIGDIDNSNTNTNTQGQMQGQMQGQQQGQHQGQSQSANNTQGQKQSVNIEDNSVHEAKRDLTGPPVINSVPNGPAFGEQATPTGNVQKMQNVLIFKADFTYRQLKALKGTSTHPYSERAKLRAKYFDAEKHVRVSDDAVITAILAVIDEDGNVARPAGDYRPVVHLTVEGKSTTSTVSAFARIAIAALKADCHQVIITGEGAKRIMEAGGFGLMLGSSVMTLSDGGKNATGTASVGGLGFASTWAAYGYAPWLQGFGVVYNR